MSYSEVLSSLRSTPRNWLVTGVAGFIGSGLLETLLEAGQTVLGLDNFATGHHSNLQDVRDRVGEEAWPRFRLVEGDIRDLATCRSVCDGVDVILHQAALGSIPRSIEDPVRTNESNVNGFLNMLVACRDAGQPRFVYAASSSTYGDHPGLPKVEDEIGAQLSPYAVTKYVNELYARAFQEAYGLATVGLRYFNVFGPRQDPEGAYAAVIPRWIGRLLEGQPCQIFGDGETSRDFTFIDNAVQANLLAAVTGEEAVNCVYNIGVGERTSLSELHALIRELVATSRPDVAALDPVRADFRKGDVRHSLADIGRARTLLGYEPRFTLREGLERTVQWSVARVGADRNRTPGSA